MKIEKINDNQIRFILSSEDLSSRKLAITEFTSGSDKARNFFRELLERAFHDYGFEVSGNVPMMVELRASSPNDLAITVTRVRNTSAVKDMISPFQLGDMNPFSEEAEEEKPDPTTCLLRFNSLDDVIEAAKAVGKKLELQNTLFKNSDFNHYQLLIKQQGDDAKTFGLMTRKLSEFGLQLFATSATEAYLHEKCTVIIEDEALQKLSKI